MLNIFNDTRIVMTLDAGGTNFVFNAMQSGQTLLDSINKSANANNLELCLNTIIDGFNEVKSKLTTAPKAISFAFPGPADYKNGIIGDLTNLPSFRGGIALGDMLKEKFNLPVFIKNDGDLFAYGEALSGMLPEINDRLNVSGSKKVYQNLIGLTLGTGFGAGLIFNNTLLEGDNNNAAEIWNIANAISPDQNMEEVVSTRAIVNAYFDYSKEQKVALMPKDIFDIAKGQKEGNKDAAINSFNLFGQHLGDAIATLIMLFDGIVVIGGGITGAKELYMSAVLTTLKGKFRNNQDRTIHEIYNLDEQTEYLNFCKPTSQQITVPMSSKTVNYDPTKKTAIVTSKVGASKAISLGAYAYALSQLDQ